MTGEQLSLFDVREYEVNSEPKQLNIAVMGQMRAGKDTVASLIKQHCGHMVELKFSKGITEIIEQYFPEVLVEGKPREYYQNIGQSLRQLNPDVWVNYLDKRYKALKSMSVFDQWSFIVTDVRQQNEVDYLKEQGFTIIKVVADVAVRLQRIKAEGDNFNPELLQHETELGIGDMYCDYLIDNSGTQQELEQKVSELIADISGGTAVD